MPPPYTPPANNAANFNFTSSSYAPPAPNAANFNFGVDGVTVTPRRRQILSS